MLEFHWNLGAGTVTRAMIKPQPGTAAEDYSARTFSRVFIKRICKYSSS